MVRWSSSRSTWTRTPGYPPPSRCSRSRPSIALKDRQVVDGFIGAVPEPQITEFVERLAPLPSEADTLVTAGDEASLRKALELEPDHPGAVVALARILVAAGDAPEALRLLARIPETPEARQVAAEARLAAQQVEVPADGVDVLLDALLPKVKDDEEARQEFLDLLETLGPDDPRTAAVSQGPVRPSLLKGLAWWARGRGPRRRRHGWRVGSHGAPPPR